MESPEIANPGIAVITGAWDDLPALLSRLGYAYRDLGNSISVLQDSAVLRGCKALYVACGAECDLSGAAAQTLRAFVENGGGLYVSDLAAPVIERVFPGMMTFSKLEYRSDNTVRVLDPDLVSKLGDVISLHMDYQAAQGIQSVGPGVKVRIQGSRQDFDEQEYPYLVTFQHGQGQVLYTVFHNAHQVNETEGKLLEYLVLRPLLTGALAAARQVLPAHMGRMEIEAFFAASPESTGETYSLRFDQPGRARIVLSWEGRASFAVKVFGPNGQRITFFSSDQCPLVTDFFAAKTGEYRLEVKGINLPRLSFPCAVLVQFL